MNFVTVIHGPPRPWQRTGGRGNQRFMKPETREYQAHVALHYRRDMPRDWDASGPFEVWVDIFFPDARVRDPDNVIKNLWDAGNKLVWCDDKKITKYHVDASIDREDPRVVMTIARRAA